MSIIDPDQTPAKTDDAPAEPSVQTEQVITGFGSTLGDGLGEGLLPNTETVIVNNTHKQFAQHPDAAEGQFPTDPTV